MSDWQLIESAPKDGTRVYLFVPPSHAVIGYWRQDAEFGGHEDPRPGWQLFACEEDVWYAEATDKATHWQPLPEPPSGVTEPGERE